MSTVKGFGIFSKVEINVFLEFSCFFYYTMDVGNLNSGFSAFSKSSLNIWKFLVHVLLKPSLGNFEHYLLVYTEIRLIIFFAAKDGETLYNQQKQDQELTVAQIMNSLLPNSDSN